MFSVEHRKNIAEAQKRYAAVKWLGHEVYRHKQGWCVRVYAKDYPQLCDCSSNKRLKGYNADFKYVRRSYKNWVDAGNKIPSKNQVLFHLDGNSDNDNVTNLKIVERSLLATMAKKRRYTKNAQLNNTNLLLTKLENKIRGKMKCK